jgi:hypothetical protein
MKKSAKLSTMSLPSISNLLSKEVNEETFNQFLPVIQDFKFSNVSKMDADHHLPASKSLKNVHPLKTLHPFPRGSKLNPNPTKQIFSENKVKTGIITLKMKTPTLKSTIESVHQIENNEKTNYPFFIESPVTVKDEKPKWVFEECVNQKRGRKGKPKEWLSIINNIKNQKQNKK